MLRKESFWQFFLLLIMPFMIQGCQLFRVAEDEKIEKVEKEEKDIVNGFVEHYIPTEITPSGVEFVIIESGEGMRLSPELRVKLHYTGYLAGDDKIFDSSYHRGEPLSFILGHGMVIPGWEEALEFFRVGDKARVWVPHTLAYGENGRGPIPPRTDLVFDMEILDAGVVEVPEMWSVTDNDTIITESGLQIIIIEEGSGEEPLRGSVLKVHYSGFLSDGSLFDSSVQREVPFRFVLGAAQVIQGFDEGFALLKQGARARFIIPPHLAYGDHGAESIPPGETLFFDVELIEIQY